MPFNAPHGIRVLAFSDEEVRVALPDRRANRNHLKGTHACAIATACEFCSGLAVLAQFDMKDYRLIMNRLEVDYMRRPVKGGCVAKADISPNLRAEVQQLIESSADGAARFVMPSVLLERLRRNRGAFHGSLAREGVGRCKVQAHGLRLETPNGPDFLSLSGRIFTDEIYRRQT